MTKFLVFLHGLIWGAPALILILGIGLYLGLRTGFPQLRLFSKAIRELVLKLRPGESRDGVSPFQALCTALAATVGTGNLVGVAGAICLGGPGAVFWMWVCGLLGMGTKFAEVTLAVHLRVKRNNEYFGGPMYMITQGMGEKWKFLATAYALFGVIASFGVGNATQINAVIAGVNNVLANWGIRRSFSRDLGMGMALAVLVGVTLLGGAQRIGRAAETLVPFAAAAYILLCIGILFIRYEAVGNAFLMIFQGAFAPRAVTGGILGSAFRALSVGCSRGVFTNEAGMGTASIAHASARAGHPVEQGLLGIVEVFLDTIVMCTLTALVILCSGVRIPYGIDAGDTLTTQAFTEIYGNWASIFLAVCLCLFAFATVLGWGLYGARCAQFLFGNQAWNCFALLQTIAVVLGSIVKTQTLWLMAEIINGLMAIPNLIALAAMGTLLRRLTIEYEKKSDSCAVGGGTPCRFPSMQTAANPRPCENSIRWQWLRKKRAKKSTI